MIRSKNNSQEARKIVLNQLRKHYGDSRSGERADFEQVDFWARFLRRIPTEDLEDAVLRGDQFSKDELAELRRRRKQNKKTQAKSEPNADVELDAEAIANRSPADGSFLGSMRLVDVIQELPRIRDNFSAWLGSVDTDYTSSNTSLQELEDLRKAVAYREQLLKVMLKVTQRELDELIIHIRAKSQDQ